MGANKGTGIDAKEEGIAAKRQKKHKEKRQTNRG
jgi:hypothetical protein